ncbi:Peroxisome biogenesis protein 1 [Galdieria sulphuraria]|nr:Peroxisome biogenesis protein 1 [Galdieria sulphuraria]
MQLRVHISKEKDAETFVSLPRNLVAPLLNSKAVDLEPIVIPLKISWNVSQSFQGGLFSRSGDNNHSKGIRVAYVAWSGSSSSQLQTFEVGSLLAEVLQLEEDQIVQVEPVAPKDCQKATRVFLQTVSDEDWSLVALHRDYLEEVLLNQVRLVSLGQTIPIRLSGNTQVLLVVTDVLPRSACSLLEYDSILQVEPPSSLPLESHGSSDTKKTTTKGLNTRDSKSRSRIFRILYTYDERYYYGVLMHPKTAHTLQLGEGDFLQLTDSEAHVISRVSLDSSVPLSHVMLHFYQAVVVGFRNGSRAFALPVKEDKTRTPKSILLYTFMDNKGLDMNEEGSRQWLKDALSSIHSEHLLCTNRIWISNPHSQITAQALLCFDEHRLEEELPISKHDEPWHPKSDVEESPKSIKSSNDILQESNSYFSLVHYRLDIRSCQDVVIHRATLPSKWLSALEQMKLISKRVLYLDQMKVIGEAPQEILKCLYDHLSPIFSYYDPYVLQEHHLDTIAPPFDVKPACCHFFHCPSGYGSTFLVAKLERKFVQRLPNPVQVISLHLNIHAGEPWNQTCNRIRDTFTLAYRCRPSLIIFFDSQEMFCHSSQNSPEERDVCGIAILFVSKQPLINYPTKFLQAGLFAETFTLDSLTMEDKMAILKEELKDMQIESFVWEHLQGALDGCSIKDLQRLVRRLILFADTNCIITEEVVTKALNGFKPVAFMGQASSSHEEESEAKDFSQIGGLYQAKELIKDILELPLKYSKLFASAPIRLASGALIYGPPGCGKTLLVRAAAKQFHLRMITVKGPELLNKYIGASEAAVRSCFHRAASLAPCILFFDELESLAPQRGSDSTGVSDRVVNSLLAELDGVEPLQKGVFVIAATSRPDLVDSALLRPGRLDKWIQLDIPTMEERKEIFSILLNSLSEKIDLEYFARTTEGYTGADLRSIVSNAHLKRLKRNLHVNHVETEQEEDVVGDGIDQDLKDSLRESVASLSIQEREKYARIAKKMTRKDGSAMHGSHKARVALQ